MIQLTWGIPFQILEIWWKHHNNKPYKQGGKALDKPATQYFARGKCCAYGKICLEDGTGKARNSKESEICSNTARSLALLNNTFWKDAFRQLYRKKFLLLSLKQRKPPARNESTEENRIGTSRMSLSITHCPHVIFFIRNIRTDQYWLICILNSV